MPSVVCSDKSSVSTDVSLFLEVVLEAERSTEEPESHAQKHITNVSKKITKQDKQTFIHTSY
ncbi:MAG: hypothetical protein IJ449_04290 [Clostridia bacterium]|nr:hypothetical protein [Clostridia bacterium]